jgi:hypothetical protein
MVVGDVVAADEGVEIGAELAGEDGRSVIGTAEDGAPADRLLAVGGVSVVGCGPAVEDGEEQAAGATATASAVMTATATTMGRRRRCGVVVMEPTLDRRGIGSARMRYRAGIGRLVDR